MADDDVSEVAERYRRIADGFTDRVEGIPPDRWSAPTPCSEWNVRDLVAHVVGTHWRVVAALDRSEPAQVQHDGDVSGQWPDARAAVVAALSDDDRASTIVTGLFGDQPFASLVGRLLCADTLIHTWDLARATVQDERLDPDGVARAMTKLLNFCGRAS